MARFSKTWRRVLAGGLGWFLLAVTVWGAPPNPARLFRKDPQTGRMILRDGIRLEDYLFQDPVRMTASLQADGLEYVLVLRVDFSDQPGRRTKAEIDRYFFDADAVSLRSYYWENSYGQMRIEPGPAGGSLPAEPNRWYRMPKAMSYYGEGTYNLTRYRELVGSACERADADVDFSQYDRDGDGVVDHLVIVHAGNDEASSLVFEDIWSLLVTSVNRVFDGVRVDAAVLVAEEPDFPAPHLGIYFHEFFHDLGAPDMYGSNSIADEYDNRWSLMGMFGPYQGEDNNGLSPSHICGYLKWDFDGIPENGRRGWIQPVVIADNQVLTVPNFELGGPERKVFRINLPGKEGKEFFLIENRYQASGGLYDRGLPESGILIWHVDETRYRSNVDVANRLWVEDPSDPQHEFAYTDVDRLTAGAAYSLDDGQTAFTPSTEPNTNANDGTPSGISILDIGPEGPEMTLRVFFGDTYEPNDTLVQAYAIQYDTPYESFIYTAEDVDYYRFEVAVGEPVIVTLDSIPSTTNYLLRVLNQSGLIVAEGKPEGAFSRQAMFQPDYNGWAYIRISSAFGFEPTDSYTLQVRRTNPAPGLPRFEGVSVFPNPVAREGSRLHFRFTIPGNRLADEVRLDIYDLSGQFLYQKTWPKVLGTETLEWDVRDRQGRRLAPGVYVYVLTGQNAEGTSRVRGLFAVE